MSLRSCPKCRGRNSMYGYQWHTEDGAISTGHKCIYCCFLVEDPIRPKPERKPEKATKEKPSASQESKYAPCPTGCGRRILVEVNTVGVCTTCYQMVLNFLGSKKRAELRVPVKHLKGQLKADVLAKLRERVRAV